jgi:hypothetical protein
VALAQSVVVRDSPGRLDSGLGIYLTHSNSLVIGVYPGPIDTYMAENVPFEKSPPSDVADALIEALKNGVEDVFPDPMSKQLFEGWKADAKALEKNMAANA